MTSSDRWAALGGNPQALARIRARARDLYRERLERKRALYPLIAELPEGFLAMLAGLCASVVTEAVGEDLFQLRQDVINADAAGDAHEVPTRRITQPIERPKP